MTRSGGCMCGKVRFRIEADVTETGACHCGMCQKWTGGIFVAVKATADQLKIDDTTTLKAYSSSQWAERVFCSECGSSLWYRLTAPGPHHGDCFIGFGTLDDKAGIEMKEEIFIDNKPEAYAFAGETKKMTEAEFVAMFAPG